MLSESKGLAHFDFSLEAFPTQSNILVCKIRAWPSGATFRPFWGWFQALTSITRQSWEGDEEKASDNIFNSVNVKKKLSVIYGFPY
jgi:hypothetical protein